MVDFHLSEKYWASKPKNYPISKGIDWDLIKEDDDPFRYSHILEDEVHLKKIYCENVCDRKIWDKWKIYYSEILKKIFGSEKFDLYSNLFVIYIVMFQHADIKYED